MDVASSRLCCTRCCFGLQMPSHLFLVLLLLLLAVPKAFASPPNQLYRLDIRPKKDFTRIVFKLAEPPRYSLSLMPGNRLRLSLPDTRGSLFKKYRRYSDTNIGGLSFRRRGNELLVTFQLGKGRGWRNVAVDGVSALSIDVGLSFAPAPPSQQIPGREKIWSGVEKLVRDFDPPLKPEIPFLPTDRQVLKNLLNDQDMHAFAAAEANLYKGSLSQAEEGFSAFAAKQGPVQAIAFFRLGETYYKLQKYPQALKAFRDGEKLWPAFLNFNPDVTFYYGDSIARTGDLSAARLMLASLISRLADKKFAPVLLVRLGDILVRQGQDREALAIYRTVSDNFSDNKAKLLARIRLYDRDFLQATPWNYRDLGFAYLDISRQSDDLDLREEAFFKYVLLTAMHGEAGEALRQVVLLQKVFPRGVYGAVSRNIREALVEQVYLGTDWTAAAPALIRFVEEQADYLAACVARPAFLPSVVKAYDTAGRPIELIKLLSGLIERQWNSESVPLMYETVADNAELLGDMAMVEKTLNSFMRKYPSHPRGRQVLERLGRLYFDQQKYQEAKDSLAWLLNKGEKAEHPESYYYLGKSLTMLKQAPSSGAKAMEMFLSRAVTNPQLGYLLPDACLVAAAAREASGDRRGALRIVEAGLKLPANGRSDEFLYRAGELNLGEGRQQAARAHFEELVKRGKDQVWQDLARKALLSLDTGKRAAK